MHSELASSLPTATQLTANRTEKTGAKENSEEARAELHCTAPAVTVVGNLKIKMALANRFIQFVYLLILLTLVSGE